MQGEGKVMISETSTCRQHCTKSSFLTCEVKGQNIITDTVESNSLEDESFVSETGWLEKDESVAVWVKLRENWQAGIRCARADWPLSTVKLKPTLDRKKYFVVFFPITRNYSWVDILLLRPITQLPQPIAYTSHDVGAKLVDDLSIANRFMMQNISVGMLDVIDELHIEALSKTVRNVMILKEFALDASRCKSYSDLGKMLLKLQTMIVQQYLKSDWLLHCLHSWAQRCQNSHSAASIELLKEELNDSILWNEVHSLPDVQAESNSEWKTWKHEVMKWFSTSNPMYSSGKFAQPISDSNSPSISAIDISSRKRPKLEVRRAESHSPHVKKALHQQGVSVKVDCQFLDGPDTTTTTLVPEPSKGKIFREEHDRLNTELTPLNNGSFPKKPLNNGGNKYRQCIAYIEAKGRQCVRWASDGDVYCCVHLASRFVSNSAKPNGTPVVVDSAYCEGTTTLGHRCKHRSLSGSSFCKKHGPKSDFKMTLGYSPYNMDDSENILKSEMALVEKIDTPLQVDPVSYLVGDAFSNEKVLHCIGSDGRSFCGESPKRHSLYCDNHLPSWLKRARNGKSRIVSKDVFVELLKGCSSKNQKLQLHQACDLFYRLFRSILSVRNPVPEEVQFQWVIFEASKDLNVGRFLMKLVFSEKVRLMSLWGFNVPSPFPLAIESSGYGNNDKTDSIAIKCKICSMKFNDEEALGAHWMDGHKKEAHYIFRGYACALCLEPFTDKRVLEYHVGEKHDVEFIKNCLLFRCIPCEGNFRNTDELWSHVLSSHLSDLKQSSTNGHEKPLSLHNDSEADGYLQKFICRFCGLKFDLLPDLKRHHQSAHMGPNLGRPLKRGVRFYSYRLKSGRLSRPRFKKGLGASASYKIRNKIKDKVGATLKNHIPPLDTESLGRLSESQCSSVGRMMFSEIRKTKVRPSNAEILLRARSSCCKEHLQASLEEKYGVLPNRIHLKAAKLCSENNVLVKWHREGFICPQRPNSVATNLHVISPLLLRSDDYVRKESKSSMDHDGWEMDESHCVIDSRHFGQDLVQKSVILCSDISFGKETVPIVCVVDEVLNDSISHTAQCSMPWENFTYVVMPLVDQSLDLDLQCPQLGCGCAETCHPETCDHVYLFDTDYENARDIYGKPMHGRFPYDDYGRIILEEGYLVYECNQMCRCGGTCKNRVLQKGLNIKLEVFRTENEGWAVRAGKTMSRGIFICEYVGEVLAEEEANKRRNSYGKDGCRYMLEIGGDGNDMCRLLEGQAPYVIDATKYGNVSRFINHSRSPNLVNRQVLVDGMDYPRVHMGLYAGRDIDSGEELTFDYKHKMF